MNGDSKMKNDKVITTLTKTNANKEFNLIKAAFSSADFYSYDKLAEFISYVYDNAAVSVKDIENDAAIDYISKAVSLINLVNYSVDVVDSKLVVTYTAKNLPDSLDRRILREFVEIMEKMNKDIELVSFIKKNYLGA